MLGLQEAAMVTHSLRRLDPGHSGLMDWVLILSGALLAWLFWPATHL